MLEESGRTMPRAVTLDWPKPATGDVGVELQRITREDTGELFDAVREASGAKGISFALKNGWIGGSDDQLCDDRIYSYVESTGPTILIVGPWEAGSEYAKHDNSGQLTLSGAGWNEGDAVVLRRDPSSPSKVDCRSLLAYRLDSMGGHELLWLKRQLPLPRPAAPHDALDPQINPAAKAVRIIDLRAH